MTLFRDISTSSCFFLLLCSFKLLANNSQKAGERGKTASEKSHFFAELWKTPYVRLRCSEAADMLCRIELCGWKLFAAR